MNEIDPTGLEPVYPVAAVVQNQSTGDTSVFQYASTGLTIRDAFAIAAMQALLGSDRFRGWTAEMYSDEAYEVADAMVKARKP